MLAVLPSPHEYIHTHSLSYLSLSLKQDHGLSTWFWRMTFIYVAAATIFQANLAVSAWTVFLNTGFQMKLTQALAAVRGQVRVTCV